MDLLTEYRCDTYEICVIFAVNCHSKYPMISVLPDCNLKQLMYKLEPNPKLIETPKQKFWIRHQSSRLL